MTSMEPGTPETERVRERGIEEWRDREGFGEGQKGRWERVKQSKRSGKETERGTQGHLVHLKMLLYYVFILPP